MNYWSAYYNINYVRLISNNAPITDATRKNEANALQILQFFKVNNPSEFPETARVIKLSYSFIGAMSDSRENRIPR